MATASFRRELADICGAVVSGITWRVPVGVDDAEQGRRLFPLPTFDQKPARPLGEGAAAAIRTREYVLFAASTHWCNFVNYLTALSRTDASRSATMLPRLRDQRKARRYPLRRTAQIVLSAQQQPVACVIWDMSDGGARLAVAHPIATLPRAFTLVLYRGASVQRNCQVVWTDTRFVGVKFV